MNTYIDTASFAFWKENQKNQKQEYGSKLEIHYDNGSKYTYKNVTGYSIFNDSIRVSYTVDQKTERQGSVTTVKKESSAYSIVKSHDIVAFIWYKDNGDVVVKRLKDVSVNVEFGGKVFDKSRVEEINNGH